VRYLGELDAAVYRGGLALVSLGGAGLVAAAAHESTVLGRVLAVAPLRWVGVRSYGIYLWHWPVLLLAGSLVHAPGAAGVVAKLVVSTLALGLAAISWRHLEQPIRANGFGESIRRALRPLRQPEAVRRPAVALSATASLAVVALAVSGLLTARPVTDTAAAQLAAGARAVATATAPDKPDLRLAEPTSSPPGNSGPEGPTLRRWAPVDRNKKLAAEDRKQKPDRDPTQRHGERHPSPRRGPSVTAIGDSVMLAAVVELQERLPGIVIDADVGRQMADVPGVVRSLRADGRLRDVVILAIGNNGTVSSDQMRAVLREMGPDRSVVLINTYVSLSWQVSVNSVLARTAARERRVTLVDWHSAAQAHSDLLYDAVHPRPEGAEIYARLVAAEVRRAYRELVAEQHE
jgi:hypothetical protein